MFEFNENWSNFLNIVEILWKTLKMYNVMNNYSKCSPFLSDTLIFCECLITELLKLP